MTLLEKIALCTSATVLTAAVLVGNIGLRPATALTPASEFVSHRAVYDLKLAQTRGKSSTVSARGRILYDFSGNVCEGYVLQFRQVSELDNGEGKIVLSDLRATTWEEGVAKSFRFNSQNRLNERLVASVDGRADRQQDKVTVALIKPEDKTFSLESSIAFQPIICAESSRLRVRTRQFSKYPSSTDRKRVKRSTTRSAKKVMEPPNRAQQRCPRRRRGLPAKVRSFDEEPRENRPRM